MVDRQRIFVPVGHFAIGALMLAAFVALAASPRRVAAQTVVGTVLEAETGRPVTGALVELLGGDGSRRTTALTDAAGRFVLRPGVAGTYSLRVEQIGRRTQTSESFGLAAGESASRTIRLPLEAISLEAIEVPGEQRCRVRPGAGELTARLWNEARKALEVARWVDENAALEYRVLQFRRQVDPESGRVLEESSTSKTGFSDASPFVSSAPDSLARFGFVWQLEGGDFQYHAPDAHVLLSDAFLDGHCFRVREDDAPAPGLIGLAFESVDRRPVTDIHGVLWLDRRTAELRSLEYRYDRLPGGLTSDRVGGTLVFERIPGGPFIVRRWQIRMPIVGVRQIQLAGQRERRTFLHRLIIEGGEVLEARSPTGDAALIAAELATVAGTVYDSVAGSPIADAVVRLDGTDRSVRTDRAGRFTISGVPDGRYTVFATSPRLDSLGITALRGVAELKRGEATTVVLATPSLATMLAQECLVEGDDLPAPVSAADPGYGALREGGGILVGSVRDSASGVALGGAAVSVSWTVEDVTPTERAVAVESAARELDIAADAQGRWRACHLPEDVRFRVSAEALGTRSDVVEVRLAAGEIRNLDLFVQLDPRDGSGSEVVRLDPLDVRARTEADERDRRTAHSQAMYIGRADIERYVLEGAVDLRGILKRHDASALHISKMMRGPNPVGTCIESPRNYGMQAPGECAMVLVVIDGARLPGAVARTYVESLLVDEIMTIELLPPTAGTFRFGELGGNGVLMITTRRGR